MSLFVSWPGLVYWLGSWPSYYTEYANGVIFLVLLVTQCQVFFGCESKYGILSSVVAMAPWTDKDYGLRLIQVMG